MELGGNRRQGKESVAHSPRVLERQSSVRVTGHKMIPDKWKEIGCQNSGNFMMNMVYETSPSSRGLINHQSPMGLVILTWWKSLACLILPALGIHNHLLSNLNAPHGQMILVVLTSICQECMWDVSFLIRDQSHATCH